MSEHLHHGFLRYSGPRCTRRRVWGRTLAGVLLLVALAALTGWLWHCVRHATLVRVPGMAMLPLAVMDGHSAAGLACLAVVLPAVAAVAFWATWKLRGHEADGDEDGIYDDQGWPAEYAGYLAEGADEPEKTAADTVALRIPVDDLDRILTAALKQAEHVRARAVLTAFLPSKRDGRIDRQLGLIRDEQSLLIGCLKGLLDHVHAAHKQKESL